MYVLITLQTIALAMSLGGTRWKVFRYRDNLILKMAFWPGPAVDLARHHAAALLLIQVAWSLAGPHRN